MNQTMRDELNTLGHAVRAAHPMDPDSNEKAKSAVIRARWDALDAGLRTLGIEPHRSDEYGNMHGRPHHWHTAQDDEGYIYGIWSGSPEQALAELAEVRGKYIVWCVRDWTDDLKSPLIEHYRAKYTKRANEQPIVAPVTVLPESIAGPVEPEPSLFDGMGWEP